MTTTGTRHSIRSRSGIYLSATIAVGLLLASGCTGAADGGGSFLTAGQLRLVSFDSCAAASEGLRAAALDHVGPWGVGIGRGAMAELDSVAEDGAAQRAGAAAEPAPAPANDQAGTEFAAPTGPTYSGTNVHEAGVDEPDLVKTDGRRIVTIADGTLRVVDALRRVETGTLSLRDDQPPGWQVSDLLLHGDRALVLVRGGWWDAMPLPMPEPVPGGDAPGAAGKPAPVDILPPPEPIAGPRLLLVDLTGQPRVVSEYTVDGELVDARAVGPTARVVVRSGPRLQFPMLEPDATEKDRLAANRAAVAEADVSDWLPRYQIIAAGRTTTGQVECTSLSHPDSFSGTSMLTVLTFDLGGPALGDGSPVSVVADGDTVYSNGRSLYVASDQRWRAVVETGPDGQPELDERTEIYKFDVSQPGSPRYVAAGAVPGWLINQYAMSEWDGHLRVATTSGDLWWGEETASEPASESAVYVLSEQDGALVEVGSVDGLGHTERIYAVRFAGPVGYVVTFRETDPLYTVDLSDPSAPEVVGELKITGYSAYLHPIAEDLVLGIGQEADLRGVTQGTQISLFDVSDLSEPELLAQHHIQYGHSEAEFDPHAFLWWPAERLVVVPLTAAPTELGRGDLWAPEHGALVLRVGDRSFTELEVITHPPAGDWERTGQIRRSLVINDTLWTLSAAGLQADTLAALDTVAWLPFR